MIFLKFFSDLNQKNQLFLPCMLVILQKKPKMVDKEYVLSAQKCEKAMQKMQCRIAPRLLTKMAQLATFCIFVFYFHFYTVVLIFFVKEN